MIELTNKKGVVIPPIGLGTFPFKGQEMANMMIEAVKVGYRLFDTADDYFGEFGIGLGIKKLEEDHLASREDIFIQTKISDNNATANEPLKGVYFNPHSLFMKRHNVDEIVREKVSISLREMNTTYLDSLLIHYPFPGYIVDIWKTMINLKNEGIVRYIGVSNFHENHIKELVEATGVSPEINECYASPIGCKQSLVDYCNSINCLFITYSPLIDVAANRISKDQIAPIMQKYHKSLAQIVLRWNIDRGCFPLPKTKSPKRLLENFEIFDFSLTSSELEIISRLNYNFQYIVESKTCPGI